MAFASASRAARSAGSKRVAALGGAGAVAGEHRTYRSDRCCAHGRAVRRANVAVGAHERDRVESVSDGSVACAERPPSAR